VLRHGTVVEVGTHESLLAMDGGTYKQLWEAQELISYEEPDTEIGDADAPLESLELQKSPTRRITPEKIENGPVDSDDHAASHRIGVVKVYMSIWRSQRKYLWAYILLMVAGIVAGS
jgi:hypothetical protein